MYRIFSLLLIMSACAEEIQVARPDHKDDVSYADHPKHQQYINALTHYKNESLAPGSIMLVARPDEQLWIGAVGKSNLAHDLPMKTNDQFRTGSVTKMFTSVVILKLVEEKKLTLNTTLSEVLPSVRGKIPDTEKITIRYMLAHVSGIVDPPNESLSYQSEIVNDPVRMYNISVHEILERYVYGKGLHFAPGTAYSYSNTNYWLLGLIAERIEGKPLQQIMEEKIFQPLNMNSTYIEKRDDRNVVRGYADLYADGKLMDVSLWDRAEGDGEADGGLISSALDLRNFMRALFDGELIGRDLLEDMKRIQLETCNAPECEYGLGLEVWRTSVGTAYGHNGGLVGIDANVLWFEKTGGVTVLYKNEGRGIAKTIIDEMMK